MKTLHFGWEAGSFQNAGASGTLLAPADMRLKGYSISLSLANPNQPPFFGVGQSFMSQVLFTLNYTPQNPDSPNAMSLTQISGTNPAGLGGGHPDTNIIACAILKHTVPGSCTQYPCMSGLDIPIAKNTPIIAKAYHAGYVSDFEVQGTLYYE